MQGYDTSESPSEAGSMEMQLASLYAERERLQDALGTAEAEDIVAMVQSMEAQLNDLYQEKDQDRQGKEEAK